MTYCMARWEAPVRWVSADTHEPFETTPVTHVCEELTGHDTPCRCTCGEERSNR